MNYKSIILFTALLIALYVQQSKAQCNSWAIGAGGTCSQYITGIVADDSSNQYVAGYFCGDVNFGTQSLQATSFYYGLFLNKYDADGNLIYAKKFGESSNHQNFAFPVCKITKSGNSIFVAGEAGDSLKIGSTNYNAPGKDHILFVLKADVSGNIAWKKTYYTNTPSLSSGYHDVYEIVPDGNNGVVFGGELQDTAHFGTAVLHSVITSGSSSPFLIRMNSAGTIVWTKETTNGTGGLILAIAHSANGNFVTSGTYGGTIQFDAHSINISGAGYATVFVASFDSSGNNVWVNGPTGSVYNSQALGVATDAADNIYCSGFIEATLNFDGIVKTAPGNGEVFCAKYSSSGVAQWVTLKGPHYGTPVSLEWVYGMCANAQGHTFITCNTVDTSYFGSTVYYSTGTRDAAVWHLNPDGTQSEYFIATGNFFDTPCAPALDNSGAVYVGIAGSTPLTFINSNTNPSTLASVGAYWKLCPDYSTRVNEISAADAELKLFPNPAGDFTTVYLSVPMNTTAQLTITTVTGEVVRSETVTAHEKEKQLDLSALVDGIYFVTLHSAQQLQNAKVVVMH